MPLRAVAGTREVVSIDLPAAAFDALRGRSDLRMVCCDAQAVPKRSVRGLPFFAHGKRGECHTAAETLFHLQGKAMIARAAREAGWAADVEVMGRTPAGESWRADVLCSRGAEQVAFEVQHSGITLESLRTRQARYNESGVQGRWFLRTHERELRVAQPWQRETPAFYVTGEHQVPALDLGLETTVEAMLGGHLALFPPLGSPVQVTVITRTTGCFTCWASTGVLMAVLLCPPGLPGLAVAAPGTTPGLAAWTQDVLGPARPLDFRSLVEWPAAKPRIYACPGCGQERPARVFRPDEGAWRHLVERATGEGGRRFWFFMDGPLRVAMRVTALREGQLAWWRAAVGETWVLKTLMA